ncbi:Annexin A13 [Cercospora beticola]|uniref:Annexin A13 n=1 Tax=Cercospora beticola TaxID=122368 RepID=A0A2G5HPB9_CERBT|nr:Annexin A13 [Cercospora beticola]PIA94401.1 Annexin A13 [Cercospora beticola]WPB04861.1 hypothetical protein RHO25_009508 [Cercospora beticola]
MSYHQGYGAPYQQHPQPGGYYQQPAMNQGYGQPQGYGAPPPGPPPPGGAPQLPPGWTSQFDHASQRQYYISPTGASQWDPPPPPQQGFGGPPPGPPPPAQGGYGQHPQHPQQQPQPGGYPQQPYGGAPSGPAALPSPGYDLRQRSNMDVTRAADDLRAAMKGFGTNETKLIQVLSSLGPLEIASVKQVYTQRHKRDLFKDVHSETSGYFREGCEAIIRGPLEQDCFVIYEALKGMGTKESALDDVLLARSNADMNAIKQHYKQMYGKSLESAVKGDLSMKTERMFDMVMSARRNEESTPVIPQQTDQDVKEIYGATEGRAGADQMTVCSILTSRSNGQIRAIVQAYQAKYHRSLETVIKKEFSGHMEDALLFIINAANDPAKHDADLLEASMAGLGTKDQALVRRVVMIHWDKQRLQQCKAAYKHFYKKDLAARVQGETSGDYKNLMVACVS